MCYLCDNPRFLNYKWRYRYLLKWTEDGSGLYGYIKDKKYFKDKYVYEHPFKEKMGDRHMSIKYNNGYVAFKNKKPTKRKNSYWIPGLER